MSERQRATGECDCGAVIYGKGDKCDGCRIGNIERKLVELESRLWQLEPPTGDYE